MKKAFSVFMFTVAFGLVSASAATSHNFDLIVAPSRFSVVQVMNDVIARRPAVLVSYQLDSKTSEVLTHVWDGTAWNPITLHDLRELSFVQKTPTRAILIGDEELMPASVRDSLSWMPEVVYIRDLSNASLLNEMGRLMKFSSREWQWFSARYNLNLEDEAAALRNSSWYDQPGPLKKGADSDYQPAPVTSTRQTLNPPSSLPSINDVERPSDVPVATGTTVDQSTDDLDELVETLDPDAGNANVDEAPIK
jgi:hypothetical protein